MSKSDNFQSCRFCGDQIPLGRLKFCDGDECRSSYQKLTKGQPEVRYESLKRVMQVERIPYDDPLYKPSVYFDLIQNGNARCVYCGGPMSPTGHGLDRKVSSLGHCFENCVVACGFCNMFRAPRGANSRGKDSISHDDMLKYFKEPLTRRREVEEMAAPKRKQ